MKWEGELTAARELKSVFYSLPLEQQLAWGETVLAIHHSCCQPMGKVIYAHYLASSWIPKLPFQLVYSTGRKKEARKVHQYPVILFVLPMKGIKLPYCRRNYGTEAWLPCCCVQDDGEEKRSRAPQDSQAIVSISILIQPLLAQFTALTTW